MIEKEKKGKIVLFRGNVEECPRGSTFFPLGLLSIAAPLDEEGYNVKIVDAAVDKNYDDIILRETEGALCFGIGTMTGYQIQTGLKMAEKVRKKYPNIPIIWGGFHPSILPKQTAEHPLVDIVVVGQGERTFQEVVHSLQNNSSLKNVLGIVYKENGNIIENPPRPFESLDNFPSYAFHLVDIDKYLFESEIGKKSANYVSSYGCPYNCTFCAEQKMFKRRWLPRSSKKVVDDLEVLKKKYRVDGIYMQDNNFFQDTERVREI